MNATQKCTILYAEDDADDIFLVEQAFKKFGHLVHLVHVSDGLEVIHYLEKNRATDIPSLILLDMNMPGMDGRETLVKLKGTQDWKNIPVIIFTTSSSELDKKFAEKWGASFMTKPLMFPELEDMAAKFYHLCSDDVKKAS